MHAIRQDVIILPGGRIEIVSPELTPGAHAEVIVIEEPSKARQRGAQEPSPAARGSSARRKDPESVNRAPMEKRTDGPLGLRERRAFMKLSLHERRRILAEQAERMADHYKEDAEVRNLGGGDFTDC